MVRIPSPRELGLHPFLIPLFPVLFLFARNQDHIPLKELWVPFAGVALLALLALAAGSLLTGRPGETAIWVSLTSLWVFAFGPLDRAATDLLYALVERRPPLSALLLAWGAVPVILVALLARAGVRLAVVRRVLDGAGAALILMAVVPIVQQQAALARESGRPPERSIAALPGTAGALPNLYYVILDSYGREDLLREKYGIDNAPMTAFLRSRGFFVGDQSRSNYGQTTVSLASSLNLAYVQDLLDPETEASSSRVHALRLMREAEVFRRLRSLGYTVITYQSQYAVANIDNQDLHVRYSPLRHEFFDGLLAQTPADPLLELSGSGLSSIEYHRRAILHAFESIPATDRARSPFMVFAHLMTPHPPFAFDPAGANPLPGNGFTVCDGNLLGMEPRRYRELYAGQLAFINGRLREMVDRLVASDPGSVIVLQADHGPGSEWNRENIGATDLKERFSILYAVRLPGGRPGPFHPSITPVNTFRVVFAECFGDSLPLLEDRSYYSRMTLPYRFEEVFTGKGGVR